MATVAPKSSAFDAAARGARFRAAVEIVMHVFLLACATISIITTVGIVLVLLIESLQFFKEVSVWEFLTGTKWSPRLAPQHFGILPLACGTLLVTLGSAIIAIPIGLGTAIFLSEYASGGFRDVAKPLLEILAGIPSVVYGYLAVVFVSPIVRSIFPSADLFNALNACIVVGFMILPTIVSISEDVLRSVPRSLREGAYALGATKLDVTVGVVIPAAMSGIMASFLLAIARAVGETMAVGMAAGATPVLTLSFLTSIQTMSAYILQVTLGDSAAGTLEYHTIFAVGLALFVSTLALNVFAQWILSRVREKYE
jgi:phosphate transport system permease protein